MENHPSQNSTEEELKAQISQLVAENNMLRKRLSQYEEVPPPSPISSPSKSQTQRTDGASDNFGQSKTSVPPRSNPVSEQQSEHQPSTGSNQKD